MRHAPPPTTLAAAMDPHPTPFPGKRRPVAAPAAPALKVVSPKPKSIGAARAARMAKRSPTGNANAAPQPRPPRRAFGTTRSSNAPAEKPPPPLQKPTKASPPALQKPSKLSPPALQKPSKLSPLPLQKPSKLSPPPLQKPSKLSPPAMQKPLKLSPPNPVRATKPSKLAAKPLKKLAAGANPEAKIKKRSQRVSFQEAAVETVASGSEEKAKASADDALGHTPMVAMRAAEKPAKVVAAETPFFSAQNCSSCTIDQLESATYWLAQIGLAESVGKHWVAAEFFRLAFECQSQPIHRIQSELRSYTARHESAGTLTPLFDELLTAHGMLVNQPKFDTEGCEKVDKPLTTDVVDKNDSTTLQVDECLECGSGDDLIDVGAVIFDKDDEDCMDQPSFQKKLNEGFEFDDSEAVIVGQLDEANFDLPNELKVPCSSEMVQVAFRSSLEKMSPKESIIAVDASSERLSLDNPLGNLSPSMSSSSKLLSTGSPFEMKSPLSSKRLTSSCPSHKKSTFTGDLSSKQMPSGSRSDRKHNAIAEAADQESKITQDMTPDCPALVNQLESKRLVNDAANNEIH